MGLLRRHRKLWGLLTQRHHAPLSG
jgi:hypothetical protein